MAPKARQPSWGEQALVQTKLLETIRDKIHNIEKRQSESQGEGTDAARASESWARGINANQTEMSRAMLRRRIVYCNSPRATSYSSIWAEKDFVRAEKLCYLFDEQFVRGVPSGHRSSDSYDDMGSSLPSLPLWRGKACQENEIEIEGKCYNEKYKQALYLLPRLPQLSIEYMAMQELMLPVNARHSCEAYKGEPRCGAAESWQELRHAMRRVSIVEEETTNPFQPVHALRPRELYNLLPRDVRSFCEHCPACVGVEDSPHCNSLTLIRSNHELAITIAKSTL